MIPEAGGHLAVFTRTQRSFRPWKLDVAGARMLSRLRNG